MVVDVIIVERRKALWTANHEVYHVSISLLFHEHYFYAVGQHYLADAVVEHLLTDYGAGYSGNVEAVHVDTLQFLCLFHLYF